MLKIQDNLLFFSFRGFFSCQLCYYVELAADNCLIISKAHLININQLIHHLLFLSSPLISSQFFDARCNNPFFILPFFANLHLNAKKYGPFVSSYGIEILKIKYLSVNKLLDKALLYSR